MYPNSIKNIIDCFKDLPGIGEKTAERLAFSLINFIGLNLAIKMRFTAIIIIHRICGKIVAPYT